MAKKIQKITEERNVPDDIVENAATPDVMPDANTVNDDNTVAPDLNVVENPSASVSDSTVAEAVLEQETTAVANSVALDSDPINRPIEGEQKKAEEALADRVRVVSPMKLVVKRFFRSKLSVIGLAVFLAVLLFSFLGPVFVPWGESEVDRSPAQRIQYNNISYTANDPSDPTNEDKKYTYYVIDFNQPQELNAFTAQFTILSAEIRLSLPIAIFKPRLPVFNSSQRAKPLQTAVTASSVSVTGEFSPTATPRTSVPLLSFFKVSIVIRVHYTIYGIFIQVFARE